MIELSLILIAIVLIEAFIIFKMIKNNRKKEKNLDKIISHEETDSKVVKIKESVIHEIITAKEPEEAEKIVSRVRDIYNGAEL